MTTAVLNDELEIFAYAAGARGGALGALLATQTAIQPDARRFAAAVETIGGGVIDETQPIALTGGARDAVFAALDAPVAPRPRRADGRWPTPLSDLVGEAESQGRWRQLGRNARVLDLAVDDDDWKLQLLEVAPGATMPQHTHDGEEATLVIEGAFADETGRYARGDLVFAASDVDHAPVAEADGPCVCLIAQAGRLRLTGPIGRWFNRFVRL